MIQSGTTSAVMAMVSGALQPLFLTGAATGIACRHSIHRLQKPMERHGRIDLAA